MISSKIKIYKTDFRVIELDQTKYYNQDFLKKNKIQYVGKVYLFDKNQFHHCCSFEKNYWLVPLYNNTIVDENDENYNKTWQKAMDELDEVIDEDYGGYYLVSEIDQIKNVGVNENFEYYDNENKNLVEDEYENYNTEFEKVREYCCGNHYI